MGALLADRSAMGLLDQTLVVPDTEFGGTARINDNDGREHHDKAVTCLLAGAGIEKEHAQRGDSDTVNIEGTRWQAAILGQAMSALLADLHAKGLTDPSLVVP